MIYDTIIIGSGPAGVAAGIYAVRREMKTLIIGKEPGGQLIWAGEIENYPGVSSIKSYELINNFLNHVKGLGVEVKQDEVNVITKNEEGFFDIFTNKEKLVARTIILAIGLVPRRLAIPGEKEFSGKGVSYCANCDGPFFKNKNVAIIGGGNSALDAAEVMSKIAQKVYLVYRGESFKAFDVLVKEVESIKNIEILKNTDTKEIMGNGKVEKIVISCNNEIREIVVDGVFVEVGRIANTDIVSELVKRDEKNQILVNENCETSMPGIFAAGDVTQIEYKQISIASGQGTIAALAAYKYLQLKQGKTAKTPLDRSVKK